MISSPLEPELAAKVAALDVVSELIYDPSLLAPIRYPNDHIGDPGFALGAADRQRWDTDVARTNVLFGYPKEAASELAAALAKGPLVRFVQGTSAGMGAHVKRAQLDAATLDRVQFASAAGVHAGMLAEFALYGLLALRKDARRLEAIREARRWDHYVMGELDGSTIGVVGMGQIGTAIAQRARSFGMRTIGFTRDGAPLQSVDATHATGRLAEQAPALDALAVTLPMTDATTGMVSRDIIAALPARAIVINVGRGSVVDQRALIDALERKAIAGAVLDVFAEEPLPPDNPLWTLPNVVMSPHTAAISIHENARIVDLFCDNLNRFARGEPLRNAINLREFY